MALGFWAAEMARHGRREGAGAFKEGGRGSRGRHAQGMSARTTAGIAGGIARPVERGKREMLTGGPRLSVGERRAG